MKIRIEAEYRAFTDLEFDLPDGKTWDDVDHWFLKWDEIHIYFKGSDEPVTQPMNDFESGGAVDWKRPAHTIVYEVHGDDENQSYHVVDEMDD